MANQILVFIQAFLITTPPACLILTSLLVFQGSNNVSLPQKPANSVSLRAELVILQNTLHPHVFCHMLTSDASLLLKLNPNVAFALLFQGCQDSL